MHGQSKAKVSTAVLLCNEIKQVIEHAAILLTTAVATTSVLLPLLRTTRLTVNARAGRCRKLPHKRTVLGLKAHCLHPMT